MIPIRRYGFSSLSAISFFALESEKEKHHPASPNTIPRIITFMSVIPFKSSVLPKLTENFSSPRNADVLLARKDAMSAGNKAS